MSVVPASYLRQGLLSNATTNVGLGLFMLLSSGLLADRLGLPPLLLGAAGVLLLAESAGLAWLSLRDCAPDLVIRIVIGLNLVWAVDSVLLLDVGPFQPTRAGTVFVLAQAGVAALYAVLQWRGLRRTALRPA